MFSRIQPQLMGKMNERHVLRVLQTRGSLSRAELARHSGLTAPTVSKAVDSLLRSGMLEEYDKPELTRGRPARKLRLANESAQVLGIVIDAERCQVVSAGLDGALHETYNGSIPTPGTYTKLIEALASEAQRLMNRPGVATLGIGLSMPGIMDARRQRGVLSPNVSITNRHSPGLDLSRRLGVECVVLQESHALCLAEQHYGNALGLQDFAMLDVSVGVGLGVMSGGRLLIGNSGRAGEIGHITVMENGRNCGCGNRGCLETMASDSALAHRVSQRLGRRVDIDQVIEMARGGRVSLAYELNETCRYLALGVAAVINLFNPSTLFVHGRLFECDDKLFARMVKMTQQRALPPSFADCKIIQARGRKRQGAVAGIIQHLTNAIAPSFEPRTGYPRLESEGATLEFNSHSQAAAISQ